MAVVVVVVVSCTLIISSAPVADCKENYTISNSSFSLLKRVFTAIFSFQPFIPSRSAMSSLQCLHFTSNHGCSRTFRKTQQTYRTKKFSTGTT